MVDAQRVWAYRRVGPYDFAFTVDGERHALPDRVDAAFDRTGEASMALLIDGSHLGLMCPFFTPHEIAMDVNPRAIDSKQRRCARAG